MQQFQGASETLRLFAELDRSLHTGIFTAVHADRDCAKLALNPVQLGLAVGWYPFLPQNRRVSFLAAAFAFLGSPAPAPGFAPGCRLAHFIHYILHYKQEFVQTAE